MKKYIQHRQKLLSLTKQNVRSKQTNKNNFKITISLNKPTKIILPQILKNIKPLPCKITKININENYCKYAYNASLIEKNNNEFWLFFRIDNNQTTTRQIGVVTLDNHFNQISKTKIINTNSLNSEDPRAFKINNKLYIIYNDLISYSPYSRSMFIMELDENNDPLFITCLNQHLKLIEKNWVPFTYQNKFMLQYHMNPHKIFILDDPKTGKMNSIELHHHLQTLLVYTNWKWGELRGGTPPQLFNNEYIAFFHSSFEENSTNHSPTKIWYVMGMYCFTKDPPFQLTKISKFPIIFKSIYETPIHYHGNFNKMVVYPVSFVISTYKNNTPIIHLSLGENDSSIKITTFELNILFQTLETVTNTKTVIFQPTPTTTTKTINKSKKKILIISNKNNKKLLIFKTPS